VLSRTFDEKSFVVLMIWSIRLSIQVLIDINSWFYLLPYQDFFGAPLKHLFASSLKTFSLIFTKVFFLIESRTFSQNFVHFYFWATLNHSWRLKSNICMLIFNGSFVFVKLYISTSNTKDFFWFPSYIYIYIYIYIISKTLRIIY
jgi:hypothetical protein